MAAQEHEIIEIDFQNPKNIFMALLNDDSTLIENIGKIYDSLHSAYIKTSGKKKPTKKERTAIIGLTTTELSTILIEYIYDLIAAPMMETANLPLVTGDFLDILKVLGTNRASEKSIDNVLELLEKTKNKKIQNTIINIIADKYLDAKSARSKNATPTTDIKILMALSKYAPSPIDYLQDPLYKLIKYTKSLNQKEILAIVPQILDILEARTIAELKKKNIDYQSVDALCLYAVDITRLPAPFSKEFIDDTKTRYSHTQMSEQKDQLAYFMGGYKKFLLPEKKKTIKKQEKQALSKSNRFDSPQTVFNTLKSFGDLTKIYNELETLSKSRNKITQSKIDKVIRLAPNKKIQRLVEHICTQINLPLKKSINAPISVQEYLAIISVMSTQNFDPDAMKTALTVLPKVKNKKAKKEIIDIINWKYNNPAFIKEHFSELITAKPNKVPVLAQLLMADIIYANDDYMAQRRYMKQLAGYLEQIGTDKIITIYNQIIPEIKKLISAELREAKVNDGRVSKIQLQAYCDFVMTMTLYNPMLSDEERNIIAVRYSYDNIIAADDMQKFFAHGYKKLLPKSQKKQSKRTSKNNDTIVPDDEAIPFDDSVEIIDEEQLNTNTDSQEGIHIEIPDFEKYADMEPITDDDVDDQGYATTITSSDTKPQENTQSSEDAYNKLLKKLQAWKQEAEETFEHIGNSELSKKVTAALDEIFSNMKKETRKVIGEEAYTKLHHAKKNVKQAAEKAIADMNDLMNKPKVKKARKEFRDTMERGARKLVNGIDQGITKIKEKINERSSH